MFKKIIVFVVIFSVLGLIGAGVGGILYSGKAIAVDTDPLIYYNPQLTTQIYDQRGELIANVFGDEHRLYAPFNRIPSRMIEAIVAIEDTAFFEHSGINMDAILRAFIKMIRAGRKVEGGSTITQQLVKNMLLTNKKSFDRKIVEAMIAMRVELQLSKEQIMERYLNEISFGHGYFGVRTAANGYFRKELGDLTLKEIAILAGLPRAPSSYDPTRRLPQTLARANTVIERMRTLGWISEEEYKEAALEIPQIYNDTLTKNRAPYATDAIISLLKTDFPDIKTGGYVVHSTIDLAMQQAAEAALRNGYEVNAEKVAKGSADEVGRYSRLKEARRKYGGNESLDEEIARIERYQGMVMEEETNGSAKYIINPSRLAAKLALLNGAIVTTRQQTGDILALVGGVDYSRSVFNRAFQARRQLGSAFKPFVYLAAFDLGYSPASQIADITRVFTNKSKDGEEEVWRPKNFGSDYVGIMTARDAVINSRNLATINLVGAAGMDQIFAKLTKYFPPPPLPYDMTIALGAHSLNLLEFAEYYSVISNYGARTSVRIATSVENRDGFAKKYETNSTRVTTPDQAYLIIDVLRDTVTRGTGRRAKIDNIEIAGKTGTTNDSRDAWFVGFTPDTQTIVWFGNDDDTPMGVSITGGVIAAPIFAEYYREILKARPEVRRRFEKPDGVREMAWGGGREIFTEVSRPPREIIGASGDPDANESDILF
ncbi:MAG: PBP1A family penicillin-binding protein [Helicobacteraceae bacterium]|jgi:penicillin-binding protein 1A|nr:PBP1A family penicillin-binding protein [Helicobacteraceae bacterium]